jgi:hypothetical protein
MSLSFVCLCLCLCLCPCLCLCLRLCCARTYIQPRHYTLEVSEEGRQWFLVHRCIVDPAKGEGDKVIAGEEHVTALHQVCLCVCVQGVHMHACMFRASAQHACSRRSRL